MRPRTSFPILLAASLLVSASWANAQAQPQDSPSQDDLDDSLYVVADGLRTAVDEDYGWHVVLQNGRPVYAMVTDQAHGDDQPPLESCNERCLQDWPLVTVEDDVDLGEGLDPALVDVKDWRGRQVVHYADEPLFVFFSDEPGQPPAGQEVFSYGGYWALISPQGALIREGMVPERGRN